MVAWPCEGQGRGMEDQINCIVVIMMMIILIISIILSSF